ncbi:DMSO/TMAO reductase YedYZ molybdopterin-dependent catalytic subunit [Curtobacterium sp. PhB25]|uniref:molybdopterin-dependent oxidoreductase n=1 Tax=unclassified Curtobacterium TaxID=257496 RepID=UPI001044FF5B|nr:MULTISPECIES: molybdopterin-dependent oxidoreductase [unclassified Curtobacterium]TCU86403.1 DMSO/TMAO reductase YedYZ molybdopterin-dependent catalytic subunit [Curtobacterium sp. PhB191]TDW43269.1 DMSO/TMAO reductase YedYZ molybdopterin-dependent catalytic subunit [Curtobacterium sp. PhB42]TDW54304.1 DMSO/TMAO reductase YedYZ molybdopterin-dependent catalytic subunit [Curtobacterium sp. PhB190]TDW65485.1 DMSO/TMAO reductase YedYZ molybdopterin-dependent catalytic subunit [Curtobacterium sp
MTTERTTDVPTPDDPSTDERPAGAPLRRPAVLAAAVGLVAAAAFLGIAEFGALLLGGAGSPLVAVGSAVIDLAPAGAKNLMVALFGTGDKVALFALMTVIVAAISAGAGVLERARPPFGALVFAVGGVLALIAVSTRSGSGTFDGAPTVFGVAAAVITLRLLLRRLRRWEAAAAVPSASPRPASTERRAFLVWGVTTAAVAVVVGTASRVGSSAMQAVAAARRAVRLPAAATPAPAVPGGASLDVDGITPYVTPNADFYRIDTALRVPSIDPGDWSLRIHGAVENEITLTWDELLALPLEEHMATLSCVSNEVGGDLIGNALWLGYPIRELLARAKPTGDADMVLSRSIDGFTAGTPLDVLQDEGTDALLAIGMNGEPLPTEHGFPARMVVPGLFGYVSATKWVTEMEVTRFADAQGYWTPRGWSERGPVKLESRIDTPRNGTTVTVGEQVAIAGVAWQPHTGVKAVQVRVGSGAWQQAELADSVSADTWRQWVLRWTPTAGSHRIEVRAVSADGEVQTSVERPPAPNGASGWASVTVDAK